MKDNLLTKILNDRSTHLLIIANIITIIFAIVENWDFGIIIFVYWCQSIIIGFFGVLRILNLKKFTTDNFYMSGVQPEPNEKTKKLVAIIFVIFFGFFHILYLAMILSTFTTLNTLEENYIFIIPSIAGFLITHTYSYFYNKDADSKQIPNIGIMFFRPIARIIPIHFAPVIGGLTFGMTTPSKISLVAFLLVKTIIDVIMHRLEHK